MGIASTYIGTGAAEGLDIVLGQAGGGQVPAEEVADGVVLTGLQGDADKLVAVEGGDAYIGAVAVEGLDELVLRGPLPDGAAAAERPSKKNWPLWSPCSKEMQG